MQCVKQGLIIVDFITSTLMFIAAFDQHVLAMVVLAMQTADSTAFSVFARIR